LETIRIDLQRAVLSLVMASRG